TRRRRSAAPSRRSSAWPRRRGAGACTPRRLPLPQRQLAASANGPRFPRPWVIARGSDVNVGLTRCSREVPVCPVERMGLLTVLYRVRRGQFGPGECATWTKAESGAPTLPLGVRDALFDWRSA